MYEKGNLKKQLRKYHGENTDCAFYGWNSAWLDPCFIDWNIEEYLSAIEPPILVIQGADDEYGTLEHMRRIQAKSNADVQTLVLPKCGHSPHKDRQESVLSAVADYVKKLTSHSTCRS